jgi:RNA polymerase sigma factor (sigma-70 family)
MAVMLTTTPAPSCSEHELVTAARSGDDRAFAELFSRYRGCIATYVRGRVHDHGRAEDITQEVFISALRRLRETASPIAFKPWVYEIAKNACIDEHRRSMRAAEVPFAIEEELPGSDVTMRPSALRPEEAVEIKQRLDDLRGAFGGLSESHHRVLVMRELEGLSYAKIGQRLGMTRQMVESTLFRARRKLGEEYKELVSGRRCEQVQATVDAAGPKALGSFGIRQRRQLSRHLAHCQPCRHVARMAGWSDEQLRPRSIAAKVAALLPFPLLRWRRGGSARSAAGSPHGATHGSLQRLASVAEPLSSLGLGRTAAVAALALAGVGGGLATLAGHPHARPAIHASQTRVSTGSSAPQDAAARARLETVRAGLARPSAAAAQRRSRAPSSLDGRRPPGRPIHRSAGGGTPGGGVSSLPSAANLPSAPQLPVSAPAGLGSGIGAPKLAPKLTGSLPVLQSSPTTSKNPLSPGSLIQAPKLPSLAGAAGGASTGSPSTPGNPAGSTAPKVKLPSLP